MSAAAEDASSGPGVMLSHALAYLERGYPIFPVCSPLMASHRHWNGTTMATCPKDRRGKLPLVKWKPYQMELPTEIDVRSWGAKWPAANIGMATGTLSGIVVLDCDSGEAKRQAMENGGLSETPTVFTGKPGGVHFWLAYPGHAVSNFAAKRPGLDFRGDGGYVLLPPSRHVSGATYRWVTGTETLPPAAIPPWLSELLTEPGQDGGSHEPLSLSEILSGVPDGQRDDVIFRFACKMRGDGVERQYAEMIVTQAALACKPPFPVDIALAKVADAYRKYQPNPTFTVSDPEPEDVPPAEPRTLDEVLATFRTWLYFPDDGPVLVLLAVIVANLLEGDPLWLMFICGPSTGKTELVNSASGLESTRAASVLTEAALLSATPKREKARGATGGLLRQVGSFGILLLKDFTSILSMRHEPRSGLLAALREVYDGAWTRYVGTDGGRTLSWQGKLGLITGCTTAIDTHHAVMAAMGERFILFRLPEGDRRLQATQALHNRARSREMRAALSAAVSGFFASIELPEMLPILSTDEEQRLVALADFVSRARSGVERDHYHREIELVHATEGPARVAQQLSCLYGGLRLVGVDTDQAWSLVVKAGFDCLPLLRRITLHELASVAEPITTAAVALAVEHPIVTVRRVLEDMTAHYLVHRITTHRRFEPDSWVLTETCRAVVDQIGGTVSARLP